jgi:hypothetical protein
MGGVALNGKNGLSVGVPPVNVVDGAGNVTATSFTGPGTGLTGTAAGLTAGNVTTNANLTGPVTSVGNTTSIALGTITNGMLANSAVANLSGINTGDETLASIKSKLGITTLSGNNTGDQTISITGDVTASGSTGALAATVTKINGTLLSGLATGLLKNTTSTGVPVIAAAGTDYLAPGGPLGTPSSGVATNLTGTAAGLTAGTVTTNANLTGDVTSVGNATTLQNAPVIAKVLTNFNPAAGTITASDSILSAIQKLVGNLDLVSGAEVFQGVWDASTNTPTLVSGVGTTGWFYKVSVSGTTAIDGISQWNAGDLISFFNGTWQKIDGVASEVLSINGRVGAVTLSNTDVGLGNVTNVAQLPNTQTLAITGDATAVATALNTGTIAVTVTKINGTLLSGLGTGILKNTTSTGVPSIAVAADFPILNQNTTGSSGSCTGNAATATSATTAGTVTAAAQPNITSVGTLTSLAVAGAITSNGIADLISSTLTTSSTAANQVIASFPVATYRSGELFIQAVDASGTKYHSTSINYVHDGSTPTFTEYGTIYTANGVCGAYNVAISGGNVQIVVTPASANSTVFKLTGTVVHV